MNGGRNASGYPDPTATIAIGKVYREQKRKEQGMNKGNGYMTSRKQYKDVKKYDHGQFDGFCKDIWHKGYAAGLAKQLETKNTPDIEAVMEAVSGTKGVGEKLAARIREEIEKRLGKENKAE